MNALALIRNLFILVVVAMLLTTLTKHVPVSASNLPLASNATHPDDWQELNNTRYSYTLWYPASGVAKLHEPEGILQISLGNTNGSFSIQVFNNPENTPVEDWLTQKYKEQLLPTPTQPNKMYVSQQIGYSYSSFAGDHWNRHVVIAQNSRFYEILFPEKDLNEQVYLQILATFQVATPVNTVDSGFELMGIKSGAINLVEVIPDLQVPLFSQEDRTWGGDRLGTCATTIAYAGCAITSLAMISNYYQPGFTNPRQMNSCLSNTGGYLDGCSVYWSNNCMPSGVSYTGSGDIDNELRNQRPVIVGIDGGNHWVVVIGKRSDGRYNINNPSSYSTSSLGTSVLDPGRISYTRLYNGPSLNQPPYKPSLVSPAEDSASSSTSVILSWKDNGDPDPNDTYRNYDGEVYLNGTKVADVGLTTGTSWTLNNLSSGTYEWRMRAGDGKAPSDWAGPWHFTVDTVAPTGSFTLNYGWATTNSVSVPLDLTATDQHSGVQDVRVGSTCSTLGAWQPFQPRIWWQFAGQHGDTVRVCAQFRDRAGNMSLTTEQSTRLDFYPARSASASYRLHSDVSAISGEPHQSSSYRLNSTAGQTLASGSYATSSGYRAALGFWPRLSLTQTTYYTITGRVTDSSNIGLAGVVVTDGTRNATTDASGNYTLSGVPAGIYTFTPTKSGYTFIPVSITISGTVTGQNFIGTLTATPPTTIPPTMTATQTATAVAVTTTPTATATRTTTTATVTLTATVSNLPGSTTTPTATAAAATPTATVGSTTTPTASRTATTTPTPTVGSTTMPTASRTATAIVRMNIVYLPLVVR